jgi:hypothetical protein
VRDHVKILGILNIVWGGLIVLAGGIVLLVFGGIAGFLGLSSGNDSVVAAPIMALIGVCIAFLVALVGIPGIIGGWGLLNYKGWARILMIVVSILHLPSIPVGTALGVYGIWVLFNQETERLFQTGGQMPYIPPPNPPPAPPTPPAVY